MSDTYVYESSNETQLTLEPFVNRQVVYVIDQNGSSQYSGQIQLDTSSLSNSGKYASYNEAFFNIPIVMRLTATSPAAQNISFTNLTPSFACGLKSGYFNLIHSISVEYNNTSVVQLTPYTNFYINFKMLTSMSRDSLAKYSALLGFYPDSALTFNYGSQDGSNSLYGHGSINNRDKPTLPSALNGWANIAQGPNVGFFTRQVQNTAFDPTKTGTSFFISASQCGVIGLNYFRKGELGDDTNSKWWFITATIQLKNISDFFQKIPLVKGAFLRFIINSNTVEHKIAVTKEFGDLVDISVTQNIITGGTTPVMIGGTDEAGEGFRPVIDTAEDGEATYEIVLSIARDQKYGVSHPTFQNCRLYCPLYQFNPVQEEQYLTLNKIKTIKYTDIYQYQIDVSCSGTPGSLQGSFNNLITNGIPNIKSVIILPFIGASSNKTGKVGAQIAPWGSIFASEPSTNSPFISLTNFNIQVAGINTFVQNENYDFEAFKNELISMNALNGSQVQELDSGLIGYQEFQGGYRYYVADLSRRLPAEDKVPKSIQLLGTVQSGTISNVTLMVFIEWEKEICIDLETGAKLV